MRLCKSVLLCTLFGFATFGEAIAQSTHYFVDNHGNTMLLAPTEEVGDEQEEETQGECILWPGCIVMPSSQTPHN